MLILQHIPRLLNLGPLHWISVGNIDIQSLFDADWKPQPSRPSRHDWPFAALPAPNDGEGDTEDWPQTAGPLTITLARQTWTSSPTQYHPTCQVPVIRMQAATTLAQIHSQSQVPEKGEATTPNRSQVLRDGMRAATTLAQFP